MRKITTNSAVLSTMTRRKSQLAKNPWFITAKPVSNPSLRLFCFCHAGGSATVFHQWHQRLPSDIEVCAIQYPGRGHRISEALIDDYDQMVESITEGIQSKLNQPFAFFGHSMGAMLSFGVARRLRDQGLPLPCHLLLSASRAPQFELGREPLHNLAKPEFIERLKQLNGTPAEVLEHAELMEMMEPILRADFKIVETRVYQETQPLEMPFAVFGGKEDSRVNTDYLQGWQQHTNAGFWLQLFSGDHFYYLQQPNPLLKQITDLLCLTPRFAPINTGH